MASIAHLAAGAALGAWYARHDDSLARPAVVAGAALALAPDLDLITLFAGIHPGSGWAHREFTHSLLTALAAGLLAGGLAGRFRLPPARTVLAVFLAMASHGLLDTLSRHGNGPMLLWPLSTAAYEFPWKPIPGVESAAQYFTLSALPTFVAETLLTLPLSAYAGMVLMRRTLEVSTDPDPLPMEE